MNISKEIEMFSKMSTFVSLRGYEFDCLAKEWKLDRNNTAQLYFLDALENNFREDIRQTLVYYAQNYSAGYASIFSWTLGSYFSDIGSNTFYEKDLILYKSMMGHKKRHKLALIRIFINQMVYLQRDGSFSSSIPNLLNQWRISSNPKSMFVLSLDPLSGPFSDIEFEAIGHKAANKFAAGLMSINDYAMLLVLKSTGRRPEQVATLKIKDFVISNKYTTAPIFCLNIPRIKLRNAEFRTAMAIFGLINSTGQILIEHIKMHIQDVEVTLGTLLTQEQKNELPLFSSKESISILLKYPRDEWTDILESERIHMTTSSFINRIKKIVKSLDVISERTGKPLHITGYRFRYTLGTRAAREGAGKLTIAKLLDHSTLSSVEHYVKNIPEFALEISKVMNQSLMHYASAFAGLVTKNEETASLVHPGSTRIPFREKDCDVGSCGTDAFCTDYAPIACYTCPKFQPWSDAPHHLVLERLLEEREHIIKITGDMSIAAINDRSIIAVVQVINACKEYQKNA
ncbi:site-specific integrase [Buttiauxella gaviniae]|uniref:site-specific integrase n=1 Tax=Buttiauxella gaviniae TaxID=82990 RepID=UPI00397553AA